MASPRGLFLALGFMEDIDPNEFDPSHCASCGNSGLEPCAQFGSYILRCSRCGEAVLATSFMAFESSDSIVAAHLDCGPGHEADEGALIAEGRLSDIYPSIDNIASKGTLVRLLFRPPA